MMKLVVFTPYASLNCETGVIHLIANYVQDLYPGVTQILCDGAFSFCNHDSECAWKRDIFTCFRCKAEQLALAKWGELNTKSISTYLMPKDIEETKRWISSIKDEELKDCKFQERPVYQYCESLFQERFGNIEPDVLNKNHVRVLRRIMLSVVRMQIASLNFFRNNAPEYVFVPISQDPLIKVFTECAKATRTNLVTFSWDMHTRMMTIQSKKSEKPFTCSLLLEDVTSTRPNPNTWSEELISVIAEILEYLGLSDTQLTLPI